MLLLTKPNEMEREHFISTKACTSYVIVITPQSRSIYVYISESRRTFGGCIHSCCVVVTVSFEVVFSRSTCTGRRRGCCSSRWRSACRSSCTSRTGTWRRTSPGLQRNIALPLIQFRFIFGSGKHHNLLAVLH